MSLIGQRKQVNRQTYVIRTWHDAHTDQWRATLKNVRDDSLQHFASIAALLDCLMAQTQRKEN